MMRLVLLLAPLVMLVSAKERAILEIVLYDKAENGVVETYEYTVNGHFSTAGSTSSAEGKIVQIHTMGLCDDGDFDDDLSAQHDDYGWVVVVKLELPQLDPYPCMSIYNKAKRAIQRGATAVIFDVTDNLRAAKQLRQADGPVLERPVVLIRGKEAIRLMNIVAAQRIARARIKTVLPPEVGQQSTSKEYFVMGIFLAFFVLFCIVCLTIILKLKWRHRTRQLSMSEVAKLTVSKLETRKYKCANPPTISRSRSYMSDLHSLDSTYEACAICLEEYKDGQELRILPCSHEFHKSCVDPWLIANRTCPLCLYNIMECPGEAEGSLCSTPEPPIQPPAGLSPASHILTSNNNNYHTISYPIMTSSASHHDYQTLQYPSGNHGNLLSNSSHVTSNRTNYANSERYSYSMNGSNTFRESFYGNYSLSAPYTALNYCLQRGGRAESPTSTTGVSAAHAHTTTVTHAHSLANDCVQTRPQMWGTSTKTQLHRAPGGAAKGSNLRYPIPRSVLMAARGRHLNSRARLKAAAQRASSQQWTSSESEVEHKRPRSRPVSMVIKQLPPADNSDTTSPDSDTCSCGKVDKNLDYSNQSTFGSSDLPSDVSSYDSQVYRSRSPAESGHTQNEGKGPPSPPIQPLHLKPTVVIKNRSRPYPKREHRQNTHNNSPYAESKYLHKCGVKNSHKSTNHRLSQPCSIQQHIRKQTSAFSVNKRSPGSDNSLSSLDTSGISPLVSDWGPSSGSDTNENGSRAKYPLCRCPRSPPLEGIECPKCPPPEGIKGTKSLPLPSGVVSASAKAMKDSYTIPLSLTKTTCDVSAGNIPSPMCHLHSPWSGVPSGPGSLSCQICTALKVLPVGQRALSLVEAASQFVKQPSSMTPAILSSRLPGIPYRTEQSDRSHTPVLDEEVASHLARATGSSRDASPRRSMVLFTQPQGTFTTIPLEGQESYDPINMV